MTYVIIKIKVVQMFIYSVARAKNPIFTNLVL